MKLIKFPTLRFVLDITTEIWNLDNVSRNLSLYIYDIIVVFPIIIGGRSFEGVNYNF